MTSSTVLSLAILKVNWDRERSDYLQIFVPFVAEAVRRACPEDTEPISVYTVRTKLEDDFGLSIPIHTTETILRRARRQRYVVVHNGILYPNNEQLRHLKFEDTQRDAVMRHDVFCEGFINYCEQKHSVSLSVEEADAIVLEFLSFHQFQLAQSLASNNPFHFPRSNPARIRQQKYFLGSFIQSLWTDKSYLLDYFDTIVKGYMLANAVFLPDPNQAQKRFHNTEVYLDTALLVYALGYAGIERQTPVLEMLKLLYETGAEIRCFDHTLDETRGALLAVADRIERNDLRFAYGPSVEYFVSKGFGASDIRLFVATLEQDLASHRVKVADAPAHDIHRLVFDEAALSEMLKNVVRYQNPIALDRDVRSMAAIVRLRQGKLPTFVEESKAVFVTSNLSLALATGKFFSDEEAVSISPCLTDFTLTNLMWLKQPTSAPNLPWKRVMADCFAATQPSNGLWSKYLEEIARHQNQHQLTNEHYFLLRHDLYAKTALMNITHGEEDQFTQGTVQEILTMIHDQLRAIDLEELSAANDRATVAETTAQAERDKRFRERTLARNNAKRTASRVARRVVGWAEIGVAVLLILGIILTSPFGTPLTDVKPVSFVVGGVFVLMLLLTFLDMFHGTPVKTYLRRFEIHLAEAIERRLMQIYGFEEVESSSGENLQTISPSSALLG